MNHPLHDLFTSYRQFVTTTWSKPPAILQRLIAAHDQPAGGTSSTHVEYCNQVTKELRIAQLKFNLMHVTLGLQGEALEIYLEDDLKEELGDILYYLTQCCNFLGIETVFVVNTVTAHLTSTVKEPNALIQPLMQNIETLCNFLKKVYVYDQPYEKHQEGITHHVLNCFALIAAASPFQQILTENRAKLEKRYSTGFSTQASIDRADKA